MDRIVGIFLWDYARNRGEQETMPLLYGWEESDNKQTNKSTR